MRGRKPRNCTDTTKPLAPSPVSGTIGAMRRLLTWLLVTVGIGALVRRLKRRREPALVEPTRPPAAGDDPADELRRKLAESRGEDEALETPEPREETVPDRRADVHEQGRAALDEMRDSDES